MGLCLLASLVFTFPAHAADEMVNQLKGHASPYLAMHGDDPLNWQEWGPDVLRQARQSNKLIFISESNVHCASFNAAQLSRYA